MAIINFNNQKNGNKPTKEELALAQLQSIGPDLLRDLSIVTAILFRRKAVRELRQLITEEEEDEARLSGTIAQYTQKLQDDQARTSQILNLSNPQTSVFNNRSEGVGNGSGLFTAQNNLFKTVTFGASLSEEEEEDGDGDWQGSDDNNSGAEPSTGVITPTLNVVSKIGEHNNSKTSQSVPTVAVSLLIAFIMLCSQFLISVIGATDDNTVTTVQAAAQNGDVTATVGNANPGYYLLALEVTLKLDGEASNVGGNTSSNSNNAKSGNSGSISNIAPSNATNPNLANLATYTVKLKDSNIVALLKNSNSGSNVIVPPTTTFSSVTSNNIIPSPTLIVNVVDALSATPIKDAKTNTVQLLYLVRVSTGSIPNPNANTNTSSTNNGGNSSNSLTQNPVLSTATPNPAALTTTTSASATSTLPSQVVFSLLDVRGQETYQQKLDLWHDLTPGQYTLKLAFNTTPQVSILTSQKLEQGLSKWAVPLEKQLPDLVTTDNNIGIGGTSNPDDGGINLQLPDGSTAANPVRGGNGNGTTSGENTSVVGNTRTFNPFFYLITSMLFLVVGGLLLIHYMQVRLFNRQTRHPKLNNPNNLASKLKGKERDKPDNTKIKGGKNQKHAKNQQLQATTVIRPANTDPLPQWADVASGNGTGNPTLPTTILTPSEIVSAPVQPSLGLSLVQPNSRYNGAILDSSAADSGGNNYPNLQDGTVQLVGAATTSNTLDKTDKTQTQEGKQY